jgi:hypothetical protein
MATNLEIAGAVKRTQKGNADWYYGGDNEAWPDLTTAKLNVPAAIRPGKTIGVFISGSVVEYWWPTSAVADSDLVLKTFVLPQPLATTDSPTFADLTLTGSNGLVVTKQTASSDAAIIGIQNNIPDNTAINIAQWVVGNGDGKKVAYVIQGASLPTGSVDTGNIVLWPGQVGSNELIIKSVLDATLANGIDAALATIPKLTPTQITALVPGNTYLSTVSVDEFGTVTASADTAELDAIGPIGLKVLLADTADWGNVVGMPGDYIDLFGDNRLGALGENAQDFYIESNFYLCISHNNGITATDGSARWVRNRSDDCLNPNTSTQDAAIIAELELVAGWDGVNQIKSIALRSKRGSWYKAPTGYHYFCIDDSSGSWTWSRLGVPPITMSCWVALSEIPTLSSNLAAHNFATGWYLEVTGTDEIIDDGRTYVDNVNFKIYDKLPNGYWSLRKTA